jgi:hypothetical protein
MSRDLTLIIRAAAEIGFVIEADGRTVAAMATPDEVAIWLSRRLSQLPGEEERREQDAEAVAEAFPAVVRERGNVVSTDPRWGSRWRGR